MLGQRLTGGSRADRAVGLLLANAQAWDQLSADDHAMLAHLPEPHGPVFAWLEYCAVSTPPLMAWVGR